MPDRQIETPYEQMLLVLQRQQVAFLNDGTVDAAARINRLTRAYRMIGENADAIISACNRDFGNRSRHQAQMAEVMAVMGGFDHAIKHVKKWMKPEKRPVMFPLNLMGAKARVEFQPKGVVGCLGTWNFPVYTGISPLAGILAAGNRAMVKMSEMTPETAALMQKLVGEYFDPAELTVVTGGPETGAAFAALAFDHIIFTGGTAIGRKVMEAASRNLTPCTLELGGKSPVIVSRDYDIDKAARRIMQGKTLNTGQACLSPDYCLVPKEKKEAFIKAASDCISEMFPTMVDNPDYTSMANARHYQRLQAMLDDAREKGGDVRPINPADEDFSQQADGMHKMPMTLVVEPTDDMLVMQEEIFGAILAIKTYDDIADCIRYINSRPRPLGLYYFSDNKTEHRLVLDSTISGGVAINDVMAHSACEDLPFGGIGDSGIGHYHGMDGFRTFSHMRAVYTQSKIDIMKLSGMLPPYGEKCQKQLDNLCKVKH